MKAQRLLSVIAILTIALFLSGTATAAGPFIDNGDGTINDTDTGLMWQKAEDGVKRSWEDACQYCEDLELAGYDDWRAPRIDELRTIIDYEVGFPALNSIFKVEYSKLYYWSSSTRVYNREDFGNPLDYGWYVNF